MTPAQPTIQSVESRLEIIDTIDSTNSELLRRIAAGDQRLHRLLAKTQHAGRGRSGRVWQSPGGNLYFSQVLCLAVPVAELPSLTLALGVAAANVLQAISLEIQIKWPNDLYARGAKLGGILLEVGSVGAGNLIVAGIGINLHFAPDLVSEHAVIDLSTLAPNANLDAALLAQQFGAAWQQAGTQFEHDRLQSFLADFAQRDWLAGKPLQFDAATEARLGQGWFGVGIHADGSYGIERNGLRQRLHSGEVKLRV